MKRLAHIVAITLSLLIIYSGVGVSIVHYCCARCEMVQDSCAESCANCRKSQSHSCDSKKNCKDEGGCTATIYKIDLMKRTAEVTVSVPVVILFSEQLSYQYASLCSEIPDRYVKPISPPPTCLRQRLALHAVFII